MFVPFGGVEHHVCDRFAVPGFPARPPCRVGGFCFLVELVAGSEDLDIFALVTVVWGDVPDRAVAVLTVVPLHELVYPRPRLVQDGERFLGVGRDMLQGGEQGLAERVVVADRGA